MKDRTGGDADCHTKMKEELEKYYVEKLIITEIDGKSNVATFRRTASSILHSFYSESDTDDEEDQKGNTIKAAAELTKCDIKKVSASRKAYPSPDEIKCTAANLDFVPTSVQLFLRNIFSGKDVDLRVASIGQAIMQAARPRILIAPLQVGLAVQMHHCFGSKFLIDSLYSLGYSSSHREVKTCELSAADAQEIEIPTSDGHYMQHMLTTSTTTQPPLMDSILSTGWE